MIEAVIEKIIEAILDRMECEGARMARDLHEQGATEWYVRQCLVELENLTYAAIDEIRADWPTAIEQQQARVCAPPASTVH